MPLVRHPTDHDHADHAQEAAALGRAGRRRRVQHAHIRLPVFWKRLYALTFARARNAVVGDEYLARHLGSFLVGDDLLK